MASAVMKLPGIAIDDKIPDVPANIEESNYIPKRAIGPGLIEIDEVIPGSWLVAKGHNVPQMIRRRELIPTIAPVGVLTSEKIWNENSKAKADPAALKVSPELQKRLEELRRQNEEANHKVEMLSGERESLSKQVDTQTTLLGKQAAQIQSQENSMKTLMEQFAEMKQQVDDLRKKK